MKWKEIGPSWGMGGRGGHPTDKHQKVTHLSIENDTLKKVNAEL